MLNPSRHPLHRPLQRSARPASGALAISSTTCSIGHHDATLRFAAAGPRPDIAAQSESRLSCARRPRSAGPYLEHLTRLAADAPPLPAARRCVSGRRSLPRPGRSRPRDLTDGAPAAGPRAGLAPPGPHLTLTRAPWPPGSRAAPALDCRGHGPPRASGPRQARRRDPAVLGPETSVVWSARAGVSTPAPGAQAVSTPRRGPSVPGGTQAVSAPAPLPVSTPLLTGRP